MNKKVLVLVLLIALCFCGEALSARKVKTQAVYRGRNIPSDSALPPYENPTEVDIAKGKMHISFKGAFRAVDAKGWPTDWVYLAFTANPQEDMSLAVAQSELFDGKAKIYRYYAVPKIGDEHTFKRKLVAGITVPVLVGVNMKVSDSGEFPSIAKITVKFNGESFEFRNFQVEEWSVLEELQEGM